MKRRASGPLLTETPPVTPPSIPASTTAPVAAAVHSKVMVTVSLQRSEPGAPMGMSLSASSSQVGTVWVANVTAGSPAALSGILKGDMLVMAGGVPVVAAANDLDNAIAILKGLPKVCWAVAMCRHVSPRVAMCCRMSPHFASLTCTLYTTTPTMHRTSTLWYSATLELGLELGLAVPPLVARLTNVRV